MANTKTGGTSSKTPSSEPFTVYVGANKVPYHFNRETLRNKIPYFNSLLSFPGVESTTNSCNLDSSVDTEDAFEMIVQYISSGTYSPPSYLSPNWQAQTHAEVYVMAERLMMEDLMKMASMYMARTLVYAVGDKSRPRWDPVGGWKVDKIPMMDGDCIVQVIRIIYDNTMEEEGGDIEEGLSDVKEEKAGTQKANDKGNAQETTSTATPKRTLPVKIGELAKKNPMRTLLARYCGAQLDSLRKMPEFLTLIQEVGEFARDLIMEVNKCSALTEDEAYTIVERKNRGSSTTSSTTPSQY